MSSFFFLAMLLSGDEEELVDCMFGYVGGSIELQGRELRYDRRAISASVSSTW